MAVELHYMQSWIRPVLGAGFYKTFRLLGDCISAEDHVSTKGVARLKLVRYLA